MNAPEHPASTQTPAAAVIGGGITITGTVVSLDDRTLVIEGEMNGEIEAPNGTVIVSESGRVNGTIKAKSLVVAGSIQQSQSARSASGSGSQININVSDKLELQPTARVNADTITYGSMSMSLGAQVLGTIVPQLAGTAAAAKTPTLSVVASSGAAEPEALTQTPGLKTGTDGFGAGTEPWPRGML